jgi:hypothetical protein
LSRQTLLKVQFPVRVVGIGLPLNFHVSSDWRSSCLDQPDRTLATCFVRDRQPLPGRLDAGGGRGARRRTTRERRRPAERPWTSTLDMSGPGATSAMPCLGRRTTRGRRQPTKRPWTSTPNSPWPGTTSE